MRIPAIYLPFMLLLILCLTGPHLAQAEVKVFPIPAISTSKNDGRDLILITPTLISGPDGDLKYLITPMVVYNSFVGTRGTLNLFRYESGGKELKGDCILVREDRAQIPAELCGPRFQQRPV